MAPRRLPLCVLAVGQAWIVGGQQPGQVLEIDMGPNGPQVVEMDGRDGPPPGEDIAEAIEAALGGARGGGNAAHGGEAFEISMPMVGEADVPMALARGLFPGPVLMGPPGRQGGPMGTALIEEGPQSSFHGPDPLIMDMLEVLDHGAMDGFLPQLHAAKGEGSGEDVCQADMQKHCAKARSQLHCLGQHAGDVSEKCRKEIDQSVPFLCSDAIDHFCDVLQMGILPCLDSHVKDLGGQCKDAVLATKEVLKKVNDKGHKKDKKKDKKKDHKKGGKDKDHHKKDHDKDHKKQEKSHEQHKAAAVMPPAATQPKANVVPAHTALLQQMAAPHAEEGAGVPWKLFYMVLLLGSFAITAYSLSVPMAQEKAAAWLGSSAGESRPLRGGVELRRPTEMLV